MTVFEKTDRFLRNLYETAFYFAVMAVKENFRNYVGRAGTVGAPKPSVLILGNGPSLAEDLPRLIARGEHTAKDVMAVNYFALDERFTTVRPFRSRSSRRFRTVPIRWPFIWPRSPNCSAATRRCAITPDRSGRGS